MQNKYDGRTQLGGATVRAGGADAAPALWNPRAAVWWSLLLSPLFGAVLHLLNARTMGDEAGVRANVRALWLLAAVLLLVLPAVLYHSLGSWVYAAALLGWYFGAGRRQEDAVRERFGTDYPRRGWGVPILCGVAGMVLLTVWVVLAVYLLTMAAMLALGS